MLSLKKLSMKIYSVVKILLTKEFQNSEQKKKTKNKNNYLTFKYFV